MILFSELAFSGLRLSLPLIFAAYGGLLSERAGLANIALESYLLSSAFAAATVMSLTHSMTLALISGIAASIFVGCLFSFFTIIARADQIITGIALNLFVAGLIPIFSKAFFGASGETPSLPISERFSTLAPFFILAFIMVIFCEILFRKTILGLRIWAAGENPQALRTQGVSVNVTRFKAVLLGAFIAAFGGVYLSMGAGSGYSRNMSAGRGYIALAALIFGRWRPIPTLVGCLVFGTADALQILLQSVPVFSDGSPFPAQIVQALPYVVTLLILVVGGSRVRAPSAINRPDL